MNQCTDISTPFLTNFIFNDGSTVHILNMNRELATKWINEAPDIQSRHRRKLMVYHIQYSNRSDLKGYIRTALNNQDKGKKS